MKARRPLFDFIENIKVIIKTKLMPAKLRAVLANFGFPQIFQKINMWGIL